MVKIQDYVSQKKIVILLTFPWLFVLNKNKIIKQKLSFTAMYTFSQEWMAIHNV